MKTKQLIRKLQYIAGNPASIVYRRLFHFQHFNRVFKNHNRFKRNLNDMAAMDSYLLLRMFLAQKLLHRNW